MKRMIFIIGILLCGCCMDGYSQMAQPPRPKWNQQPTSSCPIGLIQTDSSIKIWFTQTLGTMTISVRNDTGNIVYTNTISATNNTNLIIDTTGLTAYSVRITNRWGNLVLDKN